METLAFSLGLPSPLRLMYYVVAGRIASSKSNRFSRVNPAEKLRVVFVQVSTKLKAVNERAKSSNGFQHTHDKDKRTVCPLAHSALRHIWWTISRAGYSAI